LTRNGAGRAPAGPEPLTVHGGLRGAAPAARCPAILPGRG
jgi:hypothetical protein